MSSYWPRRDDAIHSIPSMTAERNYSLEHATVGDWTGQRSRQGEFVHEHRFIRTACNPDRTLATEEMSINTSIDNLRRLRADIKP
ncbi:unnamed protein product [Angiostrongylus costaricensis]|uniref:Tektin n=1 Tax=Angiostrongylus costaricensis TaxID=334426 RepID=A0A0R3PBY4_ANGCS|nr:unnamed protein product [Angiostrongylus costaricensis]